MIEFFWNSYLLTIFEDHLNLVFEQLTILHFDNSLMLFDPLKGRPDICESESSNVF